MPSERLKEHMASQGLILPGIRYVATWILISEGTSRHSMPCSTMSSYGVNLSAFLCIGEGWVGGLAGGMGNEVLGSGFVPRPDRSQRRHSIQTAMSKQMGGMEQARSLSSFASKARSAALSLG